jgi:hypothetical protein
MTVTTRWTPNTAAERDLLIAELDAIVSSYHFRGSKRYPAFLKYVVRKTLDGQSGDLKERTLGVEVFGRPPDYDTSADPVVRFTAGEIRKRIAQYYYESDGSSRLQIDLPVGSYIPQFSAKAGLAETPDLTHEEAPSSTPRSWQNIRSRILSLSGRHKKSLFAMASALVIGLFVTSWFYAHHRAQNGDVTQKLWEGVLQSPGPVLIVVGSSHPEVRPTPEPAETTLIEHERGPYHHVSLSSAIALSRVASVLRLHGKAYAVKEDSDTSLTDLRSRSVILIGAMNNIWTMRLIDPLRFRFIDGPMAQIQDTKNLSNTAWHLDFTKAYTEIPNDYAIVARYHDPSTDGNVIIVGGLGIYGTEAASELLASPEYLDQLFKTLPPGWENKNLELVLKTNIIQGEAGPPSLLSYFTW